MKTKELEAQLARLKASNIKMPAIQRAIAHVEAILATRQSRKEA